jgi:hypothetical protein
MIVLIVLMLSIYLHHACGSLAGSLGESLGGRLGVNGCMNRYKR